MIIKSATLNLCLGLKNKKDLIKQIIIENKIDIMCLQETEIENNFDHNLLSFPGYNYESELNDIKSRVGTYVRKGLDYVRRTDLEGTNSHLVVIDLKTNKRIINLYRSFNPPNNLSPRTFFNKQLSLLRLAINKNTILMGDFNLDWAKKELATYPFKSYFEDLDSLLVAVNFTQLVNFPTWSRVVNNVRRESIIDHIYAANPTEISSISTITPFFGDHLLVTFECGRSSKIDKKIYRRNWQHYDKLKLLSLLRNVDWNIEDDSVQGFWNSFERKVLDVIDVLIPMCYEPIKICGESIPKNIKSKINRRKNLLRKQKTIGTVTYNSEIKILNRDIRGYFNSKKSKQIRRIIIPGNTKSIWKAVKAARDVNEPSIPSTMFCGGIEVEENSLPDRFACYFDEKINKLTEEVNIENNVYNGKRRFTINEANFMDFQSVKECIASLKSKNSEGIDRIPQRILTDGSEVLVVPLHKLMTLIYEEKTIPEQWLVAKTLPVYKKKGNTKDMENYRPIANLCSSSKIFEKLILKRILEIQEKLQIDLTNENQHGFKRKKSTSTLAADLLSLIARAVDDEEYVVVASIDLSAAFDLVNVNLLLKRLLIIGLPYDVVSLIAVWLKKRHFFVSLDGSNSICHELRLGTVQGSILGPVLYAIFISPLFEIADMLAFADDNFIPRYGASLEQLVKVVEKDLETIMKWMKSSGLKVNDCKTEACLFFRKDCAPVTIKIGKDNIKTKKK